MYDRIPSDWSIDRADLGPDRWSNPSRPTHRGRAGAGRSDLNLYSIVQIDAAGSASRDSRALRRLREDLYWLVGAVAYDNDVDVDALPYEDLGDGLRLIVPLDLVRPTRVVDVFISGLAMALREHRRQASEVARIRVRVAIDLGLLDRHRGSWTGSPLVSTARLIDAEPLRQALARDPDADLAAAVSEGMYQFVVRHRFGRIPLGCFQEIRVRVKEFDQRAWLLVPRSSCVCAVPHHGHAVRPTRTDRAEERC